MYLVLGYRTGLGTIDPDTFLQTAVGSMGSFSVTNTTDFVIETNPPNAELSMGSFNITNTTDFVIETDPTYAELSMGSFTITRT